MANKIREIKTIPNTTLLLGILFVFFSNSTALAVVTGECANCHTMHNSQSGTSMAHAGNGAAWNGGQLTGGSASEPQSNLLISGCVGCHSSSNNQTIVNIGSTRIPIVYNMTEPDGSSTATTPLAGGNFYWVTTDDSKGHNVYGISNQDATLNSAPGFASAGCSPCHQNLTIPESFTGFGSVSKGGCQACHVPRHHANGKATVTGSAEGWYRFLGSAMAAAQLNTNIVWSGVVGIEDDDWEQTSSPTDHNVYQGTSFIYTSGGMTGGLSWGSVGELCTGCHETFHHGPQAEGVNKMNTDDRLFIDSTALTGVWIRHPSNVLIEDKGEYSGITTYNPSVAIGRKNLVPNDANFQTIDHTRDVVTCISCHRPHGSPNPDMLRWDYNGMLAHDSNANTGNGCFVCHTTKDDF